MRAFVAFGLLLPAMASAHGPLHEQIAAVTREIAERPDDARLYLKRGELYRLHGETEPALADYARAAQLDPSLAETDLGRGKALLDAGRVEAARKALERFLAARPKHVDGRLALARALVSLGRPAEAASEYDRAFRFLSRPKPDLYVERAAALASAGRIEKAIAGLDEGIARLGPLVALQDAAISLELRGRRYDAALARVDRVASLSPRRETWLARRGEILEAAGRPDAARDAYLAARRAIEELPERLRRTRAMERLERQVRGSLARLESQSTINFRPGIVRANNAVMTLGVSGQVAVFCGMGSGSTDFILDVTGYFE